MTTRRDFIKLSGLGAGALVMPSGLIAEPVRGKLPKRFIFILKSSGIRPAEIALRDFSDKDKALDEKKEAIEADLDKHELPKWLLGLDDYKEHMTILQGLSAKMSENVHWSFSSVMGCFKSNRNTLSAIKRATIDFELAKLFPSPFGHVELSFAGGRNGIVDGYSAPAPQTRNYCYADPDTARSELFKSVLNPDAVNSDNDMLSFLQSKEGLEIMDVKGREKMRQEKHIQSIEAIRQRNEKLIKLSGSLAKHLPELSPVHANGGPNASTPEKQAAMTDVLIAALKAELTNVVTYTIDDLGEIIERNYKIREKSIKEAEEIIKFKIVEYKNWLSENNSSEVIKNYREYVDDITNGIVIKAKNMSKNGEDIESIIDYISESLKNKLAHDTTIKLKELYPNLDEDKIQKLNDIFKEN